MKKILVLYHARCADGTGAAWVAWKRFGKKAEYLPIEPREVPNVSFRGREIYVFDNSFPSATVKQIESVAKKLVVIDHHVTSGKDVKSAREYVFDNNHSGAVLAWEYFNPGRVVPKLLLHIEDFDLWRFRFTDTKKISAFFGWGGFEIPQFDKIMKRFSSPKTRVKLLEQGKLLFDYENYLVERLIKNAELVRFADHDILAVNSPILNSQIGFRLWHVKGPFSIVWHERNGRRYFSMRCDKNGTFNVSKIAARHNKGGGHKAAAAFTLPVSKGFPWKIVKRNDSRKR